MIPPGPSGVMPGQKTSSSGRATTSLAPHSRTYSSCAAISVRRFHGMMSTTSGRSS